jgi:hypothetical protein
MLTAIIILALLSLLVATEGDPANPTVETNAEKPVRPAGQADADRKADKRCRLAA